MTYYPPTMHALGRVLYDIKNDLGVPYKEFAFSLDVTERVASRTFFREDIKFSTLRKYIGVLDEDAVLFIQMNGTFKSHFLSGFSPVDLLRDLRIEKGLSYAECDALLGKSKGTTRGREHREDIQVGTFVRAARSLSEGFSASLFVNKKEYNLSQAF